MTYRGEPMRRRTLALLVLLAGCGSAGAGIETTAPPAEPSVSVAVVEPTTVPPTTAAPTTTTTEPPPTPTTAAPTTTETPVPEPPAPVVPPLVDPGTATRVLVLGLPASDIVRDVHGEQVRVVAWYSPDGRAFIFERGDGSRALVLGADRPEWSYITEVSTDPCAYDYFTGGTHC